MKKLLVLLALTLFCSSAYSAQYVKGYYKKDGTYVAPHYRNAPAKKMSGTTYYNPAGSGRKKAPKTQGFTGPKYENNVNTNSKYNSNDRSTEKYTGNPYLN